MDEKDYKKASEERSSRIKEYAVKIGMAFMSAVEELLKVIRGFALPDEGVMFSFDSLPQAKRAEVEKRLRHLHSVAKAITEDGMKAEWLKSEEFNDELVKQMTGVVKGNPELAGWFERNNQARNAFINRKVNGLNLSDRIWKTVKQLREEMEVAVTVSMGEGESAASMSRKVRNYLNDPDLMFRRFRYKAGEDEKGNPIYRKKWKKRVKDEATGRYKFVDYDKDSYKVGRGYYKSSTMNAMRVTRTETNMAYRMADHDRWQRLDFVLGQRIKTSRSHKDEDICDDLAGDYPKEFTFTGWHPQCMCYCTPIMLEPKEVFKMSRAKLEGKTFNPSRGPVTEYPDGFRKWVSDNSEYIARKRAEGKEPYFVRDNAEAVDGILGIPRMRDLGAKVDAIFKPNEINTYASFEPFSPMIMKAVSEAKGRNERRKIFESIMEDERAKEWPKKGKGRTVEFPGHKGRKSESWQATKKAIEELNESGVNVALLPEMDNTSCTDALLKIKDGYYLTDFKMSDSTKSNTLSMDLKKGFTQANTIALKLFRMDGGEFKKAIEYLKRNEVYYGNLILLNKYGRHIILTKNSLATGKYKKMIKGFL
jgi:hypothetical protein